MSPGCGPASCAFCIVGVSVFSSQALLFLQALYVRLDSQVQLIYLTQNFSKLLQLDSLLCSFLSFIAQLLELNFASILHLVEWLQRSLREASLEGDLLAVTHPCLQCLELLLRNLTRFCKGSDALAFLLLLGLLFSHLGFISFTPSLSPCFQLLLKCL